ncbi:MAG: tRNA (adenosine(37)-N6)-dimethylallyltransferase MiaA [Candidatus Omnitrophota bacterium]|nr:tRNA (adenosine(37)-N6)-dimethylallyltransferase MiaA [Candidatus Omnitrophota bacterium]
MTQAKIVFIVGPTAVGKTNTAVILAKKLNAEIISCDSMQIYKGMDIITSKPALALKKNLWQHLISIIPSNKEYDVSKYRRDAIRKIKEIIKRKKALLFVGGTGLYASILIDGIFKVEAKAKIKIGQIRKNLQSQLDKFGKQKLYERLEKIDPQTAKKIHPNDIKRIIRALEVFESAGQPISKLKPQRKGLRENYAIQVFCLNRQRDELYSRIDSRVEEMFKSGLIPEVKKLLKQGLSKTASCAIGIKELKGYFDGEYDLDEAKRLMKQNTRHYAKRQLTWFRKDKHIEWIEITKGERPQETAKRIWEAFNNGKGAIS